MHDRYLKTYEAARCSCIYWGPGVEGFHVKIVLQAMRANVEEWESRACAHEQVKRACSKSMFVRPWIFSRLSKFFRLGLSKGEFSYLKTYFSYLTNNRKWTGKQNIITCKYWSRTPGKDSCLEKSSLPNVKLIRLCLSDYPNIEGVYRKAATLSSRPWRLRTQATHVRQKEPF